MQTRSERILQGIKNTEKVSNAYIFTGGDNETKIVSAKNFAASLNCTGSSALCGVCPSCVKSRKNVHPDIITISKDGASIKIDEMRSLKEIARYGPLEGKWQVIIINDADSMTTEAANSFLKILEEPPTNVVFILISGKEGSLPKTIFSRCQKIDFGDPIPCSLTDETQAIAAKINNNPADYIEITSALYESKDIKTLLGQLFSLFANEKKTREARAVLEIIKGIEKRSNQKLAIDLLGLKLWNEN